MIEVTCPDCKKIYYPSGFLVFKCYTCNKILSIKAGKNILNDEPLNIENIYCLENPLI